jgi:hypothetical protein
VSAQHANPTPSVEEFVGWYNIADQYDDGFPVLRSVDLVPEFEHREFLDLYFETARWFDELVPTPPNEPFDPFAQPPFFVRSDADDRTLEVDPDFQLLTVPVLERIQKEFLGRYPLWRVILIAEQPSCSIVIYPNAIRFGNRPVGADPAEALREIVPQNQALKEARVRPRREHLEQVRSLLPSAMRAIDDRPFLVAGVLDNYEGDYGRLTICLLVRGADGDAVDLEGPPGTDTYFLWRSSPFGVNAAGTVVSYINVPDDTPFCLVPWLPPADYRGPLSIVERDTGKRHTFELTTADIIRTRPVPDENQ